MDPYTLAHLSDEALLRGLNAAVSRDRTNIALLLAHLAEFDARRLFASAGYSSTFAYCVDALHFSESEAARRIQAARTAKRFPIIFPAISSGRVHLTAIGLLAPHLSDDTVDELVEAASHRSKYAIETLLAQRFPDAKPKVAAAVLIRAVALCSPVPVEPPPLFDAPSASVLGPSDPEGSIPSDTQALEIVSRRHREHLPEDVESMTHLGVTETPEKQAGVTFPVSQGPELFLVRVTIPRRTHDKLREAQALLSHVVPMKDVADVLDRALDALITLLKRRKIGSPGRAAAQIGGGGAPHPRGEGRYIPASIRRAVWDRDQGQCTFLSADGHRCAARQLLEFDHVEPVARGGSVTVDTIRLRCRSHNQYEAERAFGAPFMERKRREAQAAREQERPSQATSSEPRRSR